MVDVSSSPINQPSTSVIYALLVWLFVYLWFKLLKISLNPFVQILVFSNAAEDILIFCQQQMKEK